MKTIYSSDHLIISLDQENDYLHLKWSGMMNSKLLRDLGSKILKAIAETKVDKIISDNTQWKIISPNDYMWAADFWFPKAEASGVKRFASVQSSNFFHLAAERDIQNMTDTQCMQIRNFKSADKAIAWLAKKEPVSSNCN
jgi:hypothetical protein